MGRRGPESTPNRWRRSACTAILGAALWSCGLLAFASDATAQVLNFRNYTAVDGLPQAQVNALHQDRDGYMWFGTYGGLSRYNGDDFRTYTKDDGLGANTITALSEDATGHLIVGTTGGGVCIVRRGSGRCYDTEDGLPDNRVRDVLPLPDGSVWIATDGGVAHMVNGAVRAYRTADGLPSGSTWRLARDAQGRIYVTTDRGLAVLSGQRFVADTAAGLTDVATRAVISTPYGLVVGTANGLMLRTDEGVMQLPVPSVPGIFATTGAALDSAGTVWITTGNGVLRYDGKTVERLSRGNGLGFDNVHDVLVDREGNVWFGTDAGASKLVPGPFKLLTEAQGLPHPFVRAISEDARGRLWVGGRQGGAILEGDHFRVLDFGAARTPPNIYSIAPLPDGRMLLGTRFGGLYLHDGVRARLYTTDNGLPSDFILALLPDSAGVWIGTHRGLARWEDGKIAPVTHASFPVNMGVIAMAHDADGRVWIGTSSDGVVILDGERVVRLGLEQGLTTETIWSLGRAGDGAMWIGSNGDGAFRVSGDRIERFTTRDGLVNDFIWQVLPDSRGDVWFYTNRGLDRYGNGTFTHYGRGDGLLDLEGTANAAWEDSNGDLWFGAGSGLVRYTPALELLNPFAPPIFIERITSNGRDIDPAEAEVPFGDGVLQIRFASPSFRDETAVRYRYRLVGANRDWSSLTGETQIGYASLAPRSYRFEVIALNDHGVPSAEPAVVTFTVLPAFWQRWWFRGLGLAVLVGMIAAVPVIRNRRLETERRRLEGVVAEHTRELETKNQRLESEIHERRTIEQALRTSEERLRDIVEHSTNLFYAHTPDHQLTYISPQSRRFLDCEPAEAIQRWTEFLSDHPANAEGIRICARAIESGTQQQPYELEIVTRKGRKIWVEVNEAPVVRDGRTVAMVGSLTDITESKLAAEAHERLEAQLRQSQKLEAVGRLAGGIAHDFNNLLTSVVGHTELVAHELGNDHELRPELAEIRRAADRAASLVAQLVAFSRQQLIKRRVIEINGVVNESSRMLQRMIGEDVALVLELDPEAGCIRADPSQIDQILINLALNARDAMPHGGRLTIATERVELDVPMQDDHGDTLSGPCVLLRVSDNGHGMDADTRAHAFEPFFTTKEVGKGSGLGLATVYGVIHQNDGQIQVESEAGKGTTFRIFLPAVDEPAACEEPDRDTTAPADGCDKVVLVVEDEAAVRGLVCRTLRRYGYRILEAPDGPSALLLCSQHPEPIHLLLSDMIMPGMSGKDVADRITAMRNETSVLFMSGHTRELLGSRGMLDEATNLIQKPFAPADLAQRVREALVS